MPKAATLSPNASFFPPPLDYATGALVIAVLPSQKDPSLFEVYAENVTGIEPLETGASPSLSSSAETPPPSPNDHDNGNDTLVRFTTRDFKTYTEPAAVLVLAGGATPTMKDIVRSPAGVYVMMLSSPKHAYVSTDAGMSWSITNTTGMVPGHFGDKDDLNLIYNHGRFVDMQIAWQNWSLRCKGLGVSTRTMRTHLRPWSAVP